MSRTVVARRTVLTGALVGAVGVATAGATAEAAPTTMRVVAVTVTPDQGVVAISAPPAWHGRRVTLSTPSGRLLSVRPLTRAGKVVLPVDMAPRQTARFIVEVEGMARRTPVSVATTATALHASVWRVVNKITALPRVFVPPRLVQVGGVQIDQRAAAALDRLLGLAKRQRVALYASNGYRSWEWQRSLYDSYVARDGEIAADTYSARPGHSEHQTGLAFDAKQHDAPDCSLRACFAETTAGELLAKHAAGCGFVVRYTPTNTVITGYRPEPWHLRYVGPWLASYLQEASIPSLEEAFGLPAAPDYF